MVTHPAKLSHKCRRAASRATYFRRDGSCPCRDDTYERTLCYCTLSKVTVATTCFPVGSVSGGVLMVKLSPLSSRQRTSSLPIQSGLKEATTWWVTLFPSTL